MVTHKFVGKGIVIGLVVLLVGISIAPSTGTLFKKHELNHKVAFYKGIDQALALYKYGFDNVALWHFFSSNIELNEINNFGPETWFFIRNSLRLPLNFSYFLIQSNNNNNKFRVLQYTDRNKGFSLEKNIDDTDFPIIFKYGNPLILSGDEHTLKIRKVLYEYYLNKNS